MGDWYGAFGTEECTAMTAGKSKGRDIDPADEREALNLAADWSDISVGLRKDVGQQLQCMWI
jgi:chromosomal replication initiator protein